MKARIPIAPIALFAILIPTLPALATSKVRIVRLSEVKGQAVLDCGAGRGFENALPNMPIVEGAQLRTDDGLAEVEFEDNSTLRLGPNTSVEFSKLELLDNGVKASSVHVLKGMAYISLMGGSGNQFSLIFGSQNLTLEPGSHVRLELTGNEAQLSTLAGKKKTLTYDLNGQAEPVVAKNVSSNGYDAWDKQATQYHESFANSAAYGNSSYTYGVSDMNYYGSFIDAAGCGSMWRPYFASSSWDPFSNGTWAWYQNAGYSWVSPYPWGWTPYHSGSWQMCPGVGWGWQPGGNWIALANQPMVTGSGGAGFAPPRPPKEPPATGHPGLTAVNLRPITTSGLTSRETLVLRNNSAGLGIPRGGLGKLNGISNAAQRSGMVTMPVEVGGGMVRRGSTSEQMNPGAHPTSDQGNWSRPPATSNPAPMSPGPSAPVSRSSGSGKGH